MKEADKIADFDFGFSFTDDNEEVKKVNEKLKKQDQSSQEIIKSLEERLELMHDSIVPFLDNLCKNPDKSTIVWPDRVERIKAYKEKLKSIMEGKQ